MIGFTLWKSILSYLNYKLNNILKIGPGSRENANVNKILYNMFWSQGIFDRILDYCNNSVVSVIQQKSESLGEVH